MESVTEIAQQLSQHFKNIEEILRNAFECIRTKKSSYIDAAQRLNVSLKNEVKQLQTGGPYGPLLKCLDLILANNEKLIKAARKKSEHRIFFSPKAVQELEHLIGSTKYLFRYLGDTIINKNPAVLKHIISTTNSLEESTEKFAMNHEERLSIGLCRPQAAPVFLDILNSLKETTGHISEIAQGISRE